MEDKFLTNYSNPSFLNKLKESLNNCNEFFLSVSFIKSAGLILIEKEIENALRRGVVGKLITSTYQNFTDIKSLEIFMEWMNKYPNFKCHLDYECFGDNGYHSKGYLFNYGDSKEFIVGSTNITRFALVKNVEWNVSLTSSDMHKSYDEALIEFNDLWDKTLDLSYDLIKNYQIALDYAIEKWDMDYFEPITMTYKPNAMQRKALKELRRYRDMGATKALVVSSTGTGKTYLAAFDAKNFDAKRVLFVVHRETILKDAQKTFMNVFGDTRTYGIYTGNQKEDDCDFLFASNTMLARHLDEFLVNEFDYLVIDEAHHATATTIKRIMEYFKPEFTLGMTATPDRMDNDDVYSLFDKNVPFELRLREAMLNDLIVPFHYYGIRDKLVDYSKKEQKAVSKNIAQSDNVEFISNEIEKHKPQGKLKCLAFCTSISHAELMAEAFNDMGYHALALTGSTGVGERIRAFKELQDDNSLIDILCTVDILNEGVDIPAVNMVLFLRPTESSTIFIQQLGRGLRKSEGKEYVTVLDFIGNNYERSVQLALALGSLSSSKSLEKALLKDLIRTDFRAIDIPNLIIDIDALAKEEIIHYIDEENFNGKVYLESDYKNFKKYVGTNTYPTHMDYLTNDCAPDLMRFIKCKMNGKKNFSYYTFLQKMGEDVALFTDSQIEFVNNLSDLLPLVRPNEYNIVNSILNGEFDESMLDEVSLHALKMLKKEKILNTNNSLNIDKMSDSFNTYLKDLLEYGIERYNLEFGEFNTTFKLYGNYYKEQIMRVLLQDGLMFMKGTKFDSDGTTYCFVGLKKDKEKTEKMNYKDKFLNKNVFQWESENNTTINNSIGKKLINTKKVHLFVRKMDDEDGITLPFTYFGAGKFDNMRESIVNTPNGNVPTLLFDILLDNEVPREYRFDFEVPEEDENVI